MKKTFHLGAATFVCAILVLATTASGQVSTEPATASSPPQVSTSASSKAQNSADKPASGTLLSVELSKSLDARKVKVNDKIESKTATDILAHGQIVIPRNTKILGHVTEVKARTKASPDSKIGITFDRMLLKDGREISLPLIVQAIARPLLFGSNSSGNDSGLDRPSVPLSGQHGATIGDTAGVPSGFPGELAPIHDPMNPNGASNATVVPLSPASKGLIGIKNLVLVITGPLAVLSSTVGNVHLDTGTQLTLRVQ